MTVRHHFQSVLQFFLWSLEKLYFSAQGVEGPSKTKPKDGIFVQH